jgi:hypothetical protein
MEQGINKRNKDDIVSNSEEESLIDSSIQVSRSDTTKVGDMMTNRYSFAKDKIINESTDNNDVRNSDGDEQIVTFNSDDDDISDSQDKNDDHKDDNLSFSLGYNAAKKKNDFESYYRGQPRHSKIQVNSDDSTDEDIKKSISKNRGSNDDLTDEDIKKPISKFHNDEDNHDDNISDTQEVENDEDDISSSSGYNRIVKKKEFVSYQSYHREQEDEIIRRPKNQDHDDDLIDEEIEKPISKSRYSTEKSRKKFADDENDSDNDDDNISDTRVKNDDYYEIRYPKNQDRDDDLSEEEIKKPISKSRYAERSRNKFADDENDSDNDNNDHNENISSTQVKNDEDDIPSSSGYNRIVKKKKFEFYHREQEDEIVRHPKNQDSDDDLADEEVKKPISKSRYADRSRKKFADDENDKDDDDDNNISDTRIKNNDYYDDDDIPPSSGNNRIVKKKKFEFYHREQEDEIVRHPKNQDSDDDLIDEEIKKPILKSRYAERSRNKFADDENDKDDDDDNNISDTRIKNNDYYDDDDIPPSSGYNRIDKKKEFESYHRERKDETTRRPKNQYSDDSTDEEIKKPISKSSYIERNRNKFETTDDKNDNDNNGYNDNTSESQVEDDIPSSSSKYNPINKKKEFKFYHREQEDEIVRHPKNQDSDDDLTDKEVKKPIVKSRYAERSRNKFADDENDKDDDDDDNTSDTRIKNNDYYDDDIQSSSGYNRVDKKKKFELYHRERKDGITRRPKNQYGNDSTDEEIKKPISKSHYAERNRNKFETTDDKDDNDNNDYNDNTSDSVKNDEDDIPSSSEYNSIYKKKEVESYNKGQRGEIARRPKNQYSDDDLIDEEIKKPIPKPRYAERSRKKFADDETDSDNVDNDYNENISDTQVKNDEDDIPSSSGYNRIVKKKEFEFYHREQEDEIVRHPKNQDSDDDLADEEVKKPILKSHYAERSRKKFADDENGNNNYDNYHDDNISNIEVQNDYEKGDFSSSGRVNKKKEPELYYGEQIVETTRYPKNKNSQNLVSIHDGNQKKIDNISDSSQDENDDYEEQIDETTKYPTSQNSQNLSMQGGNRRKLHNTSDSSQDENDDYEEQVDETTRYPISQNSQNLSMQGGNQRKLDNRSDSSQDENDDYEEQMDDTTKYSTNKNQNLSMHAGNQKKLGNTSDFSQDENDDYEEQMDETTAYPKNKNNQNLFMQDGNKKKLGNMSDSSQDENDNYKDSEFLPSGHVNKKKERESYYREQVGDTTKYSKNKNQNLSMHAGNQKKLDDTSNFSQDENDNYKDSDFLPSGRVNKKKERESYYGERMDETTKHSRNQNNQNLSMHAGNQKKLDNTSNFSQDDNDNYKDSDLLPSGRVNKKKERESYYGEQMDETTRHSRNQNNQNLSMHAGNQKKLDNTNNFLQDENDYKDGDFLPSGRVNKKKEREPYYGEQMDETTRYLKNKSNQNLSLHDDNRRELNYDNNDGNTQKYNRSNKRNESESFNGGSRNEITNNQNSQSFTKDSKDHYSSNNQRKNQNPSSNSSYNRWYNKWIPGGSKDEDKINKIKVIFHVHFPEGIEKVGTPVVLGNVKELGSWELPVVKLSSQNQTYWRSDPVTIPLSSAGDEIQYKYAIHIPKPLYRFGGEEKIIFEGNGPRNNRVLNIERNNQFDIFINNNQLPRLSNIHDFAFVDYIYNSIKADNLKAKVMEYQHLLTLYNDFTIRASNLDFIFGRVNNRLDRDKRLFLCFLLGQYVSRKQGLFYELQNKFPSGLLLEALEEYKQDTLPSNTKNQMYSAIIILVQHNALQMQFDWLVIFTIASEVDPNFAFIDYLKSLKYSNDKLANFIKGIKFIRPYVDGIDPEPYIKFAKVNI